MADLVRLLDYTQCCGTARQQKIDIKYNPLRPLRLSCVLCGLLFDIRSFPERTTMLQPVPTDAIRVMPESLRMMTVDILRRMDLPEQDAAHISPNV